MCEHEQLAVISYSSETGGYDVWGSTPRSFSLEEDMLCGSWPKRFIVRTTTLLWCVMVAIQNAEPPENDKLCRLFFSPVLTWKCCGLFPQRRGIYTSSRRSLRGLRYGCWVFANTTCYLKEGVVHKCWPLPSFSPERTLKCRGLVPKRSILNCKSWVLWKQYDRYISSYETMNLGLLARVNLKVGWTLFSKKERNILRYQVLWRPHPKYLIVVVVHTIAKPKYPNRPTFSSSCRSQFLEVLWTFFCQAGGTSR